MNGSRCISIFRMESNMSCIVEEIRTVVIIVFYYYGYKGKVYKNEKELLKVLKDVLFDPKHSVWNQQ